MVQIKRILISGVSSGSGKTTVALSIIAALKKRGLNVTAFKCGPDYIDPIFHRQALDVPSYNLDPYFLDKDGLCRTISNYGKSDISVIEGVMGYYDGISTTTNASTYDVARKTRTPVVLVMDTKGMGASAGAIMKGFAEFREESNIRGVIFNRLKPAMYSYMSKIARENGLAPLGFLPMCEDAEISSRNLGLSTDFSETKLAEKIELLSDLAIKHIDLDGVLEMSGAAPELPQSFQSKKAESIAKIAVSRDKAFCFMYEENLDLLKATGFEIEFFSPLYDTELPKNCHALWLCGGYPEEYGEELSNNKSMCSSIKDAIAGGMPTVAECGGFMYLHRRMGGHDMLGAIDAECGETKKLQRFGYIELTAERDNLFCKRGESIRAHEFHYWTSSDYGDGFTAKKAGRELSYPCIHASDAMYAGFPHLYLPANSGFADELLKKALLHANLK